MAGARHQLKLDRGPGRGERLGEPDALGRRHQAICGLKPGQRLVSRVDGIGEIRQHFVDGRSS